MLSVCLCFVVVVYSVRLCSSEEDLIVQTTYGRIRGVVTERIPGKRIHSFLGVPYATPPVNELRFERPMPPTSWEGVRYAQKLPPACIQSDMMYIDEYFPGFEDTSEDCLYLNLYIPEVESNRSGNTSVLVFVHGGSNRDGMGSMLEGDILAGHGGIIVVTINYRLGIYGFVAAKDEGLDGTYGFLDQIEALKWVKSNIDQFGGNSNMITIHGHSAGAANVGFLSTSPMSKGLFQRVIVHSGSPLAFWAMTDPQFPQGTNLKPSCSEFEDCRNKTYKEYLKSLNKTQLATIKGLETPRELVTFPAVVDGEFLPGRPNDVIRQSLNADHFLLAFTKDEGFPIDLKNEAYVKMVVSFTKANLLEVMKLYNTVFRNVKNFTEMVIKEYKEFESSAYILQHKVDADFVFFAPMIRLADLLSQYIKELYVFSFDHVSAHSPHPRWQSVPHGIDLYYVFGAPLVGHKRFTYDDLDKEASREVMTIWSDFVKGKENQDLQPYQESNKKFTHLVSRNNEILFETKDSFRTRKMHFWNKYLPSINNNSTLGANEVKMDRTLIPSGSATQTANEMKQNRVTVSDKENSSSGLRCVHWLLVTTCWTMLFLFSL